MKKRILTYFSMVFLACLASAPLFAQSNLNMPNTAVTQIVGNAGNNPVNFYDNGGPAGAYSNNFSANGRVTFVPATAGNRIRARFTSFNTESNFDALYIDNGGTNSTADLCAAPRIPQGTCNSAASLTYGPTVNFPDDGFTGAGGGLLTVPPAPAVQGVFSTSGDGALTFSFRSDASVTGTGWAAVITQEPNPCRLVPPLNVSIPVGPNCGPASNVTVNTPTFASAACANGATLSYRVDCGAAVVVGVIPTAGTVVIPGPLAPGLHSIHWTATSGTCMVSDGTSYINVLDSEDPVIACPADLFFNLDAGECNQVVNYTIPTFTDNCPIFTLPVLYTQNPPSLNPAQAIDPANSLSCSAPPNSYARVFGGPGQIAFNMTGLQVGVRATGGAYTYNIYNLTAGTTPVAANMVLIGGPFTINTVGTAQYVPVTFPTPVSIAAGSRYVVEIITPNSYTMGQIAAADLPGTPSYLKSVPCGLAAYQTFASIGFPQFSLAFNVVGLAAGPPPPATLCSGLAPGSVFPVGVSEVCYCATDAAGNTDECCFNITVLEYPNPTQQLVCNDNVQISLDQQCVAAIGADDILEGGQYGCYDTRYTVMIITPMGGIISPAVLNKPTSATARTR
ncbi:MAG: HYR domain-containing protein [Saprospiraceae bacterium]|nr:HYR domain-containing protein [Saprospiraceae bacterium]